MFDQKSHGAKRIDEKAAMTKCIYLEAPSVIQPGESEAAVYSHNEKPQR